MRQAGLRCRAAGGMPGRSATTDEEQDEPMTDTAFAAAGAPAEIGGFDLIETMAFDPLDGIVLLEPHLERMKASATTFGFAFDRHAARNELQAATFRLRDARLIRLALARSGAVAIEVTPVPPVPTGPVEVAIVPLPATRDDFRLAHRTSDRAFPDDARAAAGTFEVVFERDGVLTQGSFTTLFVERDGHLLTPPLADRASPGVLRRTLIDAGRAVEALLTRADLTPGFFVGNAALGLIPAVVKSGGARL